MKQLWASSNYHITKLSTGFYFIRSTSATGFAMTDRILKKFEKLNHLLNIYYYGTSKDNYVCFLSDDQHVLFPFLSDDNIRSIHDISLTNIECQSIRDTSKRYLKDYRPKFFTELTGESLSVFDSLVLRAEKLKESNKSIPKSVYKDHFTNAYNIPDGYNAVLTDIVVNNHVIDHQVHLLNHDQLSSIQKLILDYKNTIPIDMSEYSLFNIDYDMPHLKPRHINNALYYIVEHKNLSRHKALRLFNYKSHSTKYILINDHLYQNLKIYDFGIDLNENSNGIQFITENEYELAYQYFAKKSA